MGKKDFDKELEGYLHARRKGKRFNLGEFIQSIFPKREKSEYIEEEVPVEKEKSREKEGKDGFFTNLFKKEEQATPDELFLEIKDVSRIALNAVKRLPDDELRDFKKSADFERLHAILKKHKLIK